MVEMRQRIDRGDQEKEIEETIRVRLIFYYCLLPCSAVKNDGI